jgi:hypothetical protein
MRTRSSGSAALTSAAQVPPDPPLGQVAEPWLGNPFAPAADVRQVTREAVVTVVNIKPARRLAAPAEGVPVQPRPDR